jgi:hypothetical protein
MTFFNDPHSISNDLTLEKLEQYETFQILVTVLATSIIDRGLIERTAKVIALECETSSQNVLAYAQRMTSIRASN